MKPIVKHEALMANDNWYYEVILFRDDERVSEVERFYPRAELQDDIKIWANARKELDKAKRGEIESFIINLEEE